MPDWPHEYTVKAWDPQRNAEFESFCALIRRDGAVEPWPPPPASAIYHNRYLRLGRHKYWAMGAQGDLGPVEELTVVNRALDGDLADD